MSAYDETRRRHGAIVLNFTGLEYMNSGGIGLLVTLLVRANRHTQRLLAFGLTDHYRADLRADPARRGDRDPRHRGRGAGRGGRRMRRSHDERSDEKAAARDATNWAKPVSTLNVADVPEGALNINVEGKRLASPIQGFGKMWQKTYQVRLPGERRVAGRPDRDLEGSASRSSGRRATTSTRRSPGSSRARSRS